LGNETEMNDKKQDLTELLARKSRRSHKHRIRELKTKDAEEEIKEYEEGQYNQKSDSE